jgi:hypothetical protein
MRWLILLLIAAGAGCSTAPSGSGSAKVLKVLPHFLDRQGRHTQSPSLYERDAYQAQLRRNPQLRAGLRFDVLLRAPRSPRLVLQAELRGTLDNKPTTATIRSPLPAHSGGREWESATLEGEDYRKMGEMLAWRVTIWEGETLLAEQKSFLW